MGFMGGGGGGGGEGEVFSLQHAPNLTKFYTGGDTRRFNPLPFYIYTIFDRKGTPFVVLIPSI